MMIELILSKKGINYMDYEETYQKMMHINEKYLIIFGEWLAEKGLQNKTINRHVSNVAFYINEFLCYYDIQEMKEGCYQIDEFLGDWFIRKAMWSTVATVKSNGVSIKKFYNCMKEKGFVNQEDYANLCMMIKIGMPSWIGAVAAYNDSGYDW